MWEGVAVGEGEREAGEVLGEGLVADGEASGGAAEAGGL